MAGVAKAGRRSMRLRSEVPWVVIREGLARAVTNLRWPERWLAGEVTIFHLDAPSRLRRRSAAAVSALSRRSAAEGARTRWRFMPRPVWIPIRPALARREIQPVWARRWLLREVPAAGTEKLGAAASRTAQRAKTACSSPREGRGEPQAPRVSRRPWVDLRAILRRAGFDLASVDEVAEVRLKVAEMERRLEAILGGAGGLAAAEG